MFVLLLYEITKTPRGKIFLASDITLLGSVLDVGGVGMVYQRDVTLWFKTLGICGSESSKCSWGRSMSRNGGRGAVST